MRLHHLSNRIRYRCIRPSFVDADETVRFWPEIVADVVCGNVSEAALPIVNVCFVLVAQRGMSHSSQNVPTMCMLLLT